MSDAGYPFLMSGVGWRGGAYIDIEDAADDNIDFFLTLDDGRQFYGEAATVANVVRLMQRWVATGERTEQFYTVVEEVIVPRLSWDLLAKVIDDLVARATITTVLYPCEDDGEFEESEASPGIEQPVESGPAIVKGPANLGEDDEVGSAMRAGNDRIVLADSNRTELSGLGWTGFSCNSIDDPDNSEVEFTFHLEDGRQYRGRAVTIANVVEQMKDRVEADEHSEYYYWGLDTVILPRLTWEALRRVIDEVVSEQELGFTFRLCEDDGNGGESTHG